MAEWGVECLHKFVKISCKLNSREHTDVAITVFYYLMIDDRIINKKRSKFSSSFSAQSPVEITQQQQQLFSVSEVSIFDSN